MQTITKYFRKAGEFRSIRAVSLAFFMLLIAWLAFLVLAAAVSVGEQSNPRIFLSPEGASKPLFAAVKSDDETIIRQILAGGDDLISSGDDLEDKHDRQLFARKYEEMHRLVEEPDGTTVLYIGAENWPFPVPLVSSNGTWHFDSQLGLEEVLFRRIGENESTAIQTSHALVQREKQGETRLEGDDPISQYANDFVREEDGNPTKKNTPSPFHGYYLRILTRQGKNAPGEATGRFAFVAYPADYRSSGVLTFIVDQNNVVYEKDLGPNTEKLANSMTRFNPGRGWHTAE